MSKPTYKTKTVLKHEDMNKKIVYCQSYKIWFTAIYKPKMQIITT